MENCANCNGKVDVKLSHVDFKLFIKEGISVEMLICNKCLTTDYFKYDRLIKKAYSVLGEQVYNQSINGGTTNGKK